MSKPKKKQRCRGRRRLSVDEQREVVKEAAQHFGFRSDLVASVDSELRQISFRSGVSLQAVRRFMIEMGMWEPEDEHKKVRRRASITGRS